MDKIILLILFSIIGSVTKGNAQRQCFVCNNCPDASALGENLIQTCGLPDDPVEPTTDPAITDPEDTTITVTEPEDTTITTETEPIITQTTPDAPPTTTPQIPDDTTTTQTTDGGITTPTVPITPPSTTPQIPVSPPEVLGHKYRQIIRQLIGEYQCFVVHQQVGNDIHVNRGCVVTQETEQQTCLDASSGVDPEFCRLCSYDECNIASKYALSLVVVFSSLFVVLAIR